MLTYSLAHATTLGCTPPELIFVASRAGYDYASLRIIPLGLPGEPNYNLATNPQMLRWTKAAIEDTGTPVNDIELCRIVPGMNPMDLKPSFEVGAELGTSNVISSIWSPDRAYSIDMFEQVCELAAKYSLTVNLEFPCIAEVRTLDEAVSVLDSIESTNVGLFLDMYHVHRAATKLSDLDTLPRKWFKFCHLSDAPERIPETFEELRDEVREGRLYLGEGVIDVAGIMSHVPEMTCSIEIPNRKRLDQYGSMEHAARALEHTKRYFASHPIPSRH